MISYDEGILHSADGTRLFFRQWQPDETKGTLFIVHGVGDHSGRYSHVAEHFASRGFACYAHDYRGSGQSEGRRGHINRYSDYLDDFQALIDLASQRQPGTKLFAVGHSQGGTIVLAYALEHPEAFSGLVASAPALGVCLKDLPRWKAGFARVARRLTPIMPGLTLDNGIIPEYLSHDSAVVKGYTTDPFVHSRAVLRWYSEYRQTHEHILSSASRFSVPCLIIHGDEDHVTPLEKTREFYAGLTITDKRMIVYEGFYHELFNELEKERVFRDIEEWLTPRVA